MYVITANNDIEYASDKRDVICILTSLLLAGTTVTINSLADKENNIGRDNTN